MCVRACVCARACVCVCVCVCVRETIFINSTQFLNMRYIFRQYFLLTRGNGIDFKSCASKTVSEVEWKSLGWKSASLKQGRGRHGMKVASRGKSYAHLNRGEVGWNPTSPPPYKRAHNFIFLKQIICVYKAENLFLKQRICFQSWEFLCNWCRKSYSNLIYTCPSSCPSLSPMCLKIMY